jgi:hypothetical protein
MTWAEPPVTQLVERAVYRPVGAESSAAWECGLDGWAIDLSSESSYSISFPTGAMVIARQQATLFAPVTPG